MGTFRDLFSEYIELIKIDIASITSSMHTTNDKPRQIVDIQNDLQSLKQICEDLKEIIVALENLVTSQSKRVPSLEPPCLVHNLKILTVE